MWNKSEVRDFTNFLTLPGHDVTDRISKEVTD